VDRSVKVYTPFQGSSVPFAVHRFKSVLPILVRERLDETVNSAVAHSAGENLIMHLTREAGQAPARALALRRCRGRGDRSAADWGRGPASLYLLTAGVQPRDPEPLTPEQLGEKNRKDAELPLLVGTALHRTGQVSVNRDRVHALVLMRQLGKPWLCAPRNRPFSTPIKGTP